MPYTPHKIQKLRWNEKYSIFFAGSVYAADILISSFVSLVHWWANTILHYSDVIVGIMASHITSLTIVYSTVHSGTDQRKHQSSASLAFVWWIYRWPVNSPHKWPVTQNMFPFDDVFMDFIITVKSKKCANNWVNYGLKLMYVCTLRYLIIISFKTCPKELNIWNVCLVYSVKCEIKSILSIML